VLASYAYDNLGRQTSVTFGNGTSQVSTYDPVSRLASLTANLTGTANNLTIGSLDDQCRLMRRASYTPSMSV
jgi:hypothetical protein